MLSSFLDYQEAISRTLCECLLSEVEEDEEHHVLTVVYYILVDGRRWIQKRVQIAWTKKV